MLDDLLAPNLEIVFCGTAVSDASALFRAYYAGPGNKFYPILYKVGLTPEMISPENYRSLLTCRIGLTDLAKGVSGVDSKISMDMYDGRSLKNKIEKYEPKMLCFNGKEAASQYLGLPKRKIEYGLQSQKIRNTKIYVAPSTSGMAAKYWDENYWLNIKRFL